MRCCWRLTDAFGCGPNRAAAALINVDNEVIAVPPPSGLKKTETPQEYVARTIELDLGDF